MAAPKKLRSLYRRRIRRKGYYYSKNTFSINNVVNCSNCNTPIVSHAVCAKCYVREL